ncbi:F0F1 ATP synthase subunit epsilon [Thermopetrobacter sp. TC1]|uniref:F0F1 ATP synthase subunit epsilon n=1 Tax=Thermopetrobacter sp. TC1 TaxID=1495045 RepID=UPI00056E2D7D|nr:F0F1 ATP synthase subunit epsilon [Thermopetrobacter sp. TC1]
MAEAIQLELVSPEKELASRLVKQVVVPGTEGEFQVMPDHAPVLTTLKPGVLAITEISGAETRFFVRGGYAEVANNQLIVLAERAIPLEQLSAAEIDREIRWAQEDLEDARDEEERRKLSERLDFLIQLKQALQLGH